MARTPGRAVVPFSFQDDLDSLKTKLQAPTSDRIKIKDKKFVLPNGATATDLDVVIVEFVYGNFYYLKPYVPGKIETPTCFALNAEPDALTPSEKSLDRQCADCRQCPQNAFQSAPNGKGKACRNHIHIALLPADITSTTEETPFVVLAIPPTNLQAFNRYVRGVASILQRPPYGVATHLSVNSSKNWDLVDFTEPRPFDMGKSDEKAFVNMVKSRRADALELLLAEPDFAEAPPVSKAPPYRGKSSIRKAA